jgi:hypothetical protein
VRGPLLLLLVVVAAAALPVAAFSQGKFGLNSARVVKAQRPNLPPRADGDHDGLANRTELRQTRTNPRKFDTDGDGFSDGAEITAGSDPLDAASIPALSSLAPSAAVTAPRPPVSQPQSPTTPQPPDTTPPNTTIGSGPPSTTALTDARFGFSSSESGSTFQCSLDSLDPSAWGSCTSPKSYASVAVGSHSLAVKATDAAGNTDASPAVREWTVTASQPPVDCTTSLSPGADVAAAVSSAAGGAVICLDGGSYGRISVSGAHKTPPVTIRSGSDGRATVAGITLTDPSGLRFMALDITGGTTVTPSGTNIQFIDNDITGVAGIYLFGDYRIGKRIENVLIEGNLIHDIDYSGNQSTGYGYGIEGVGEIRGMTIRGNTIKSPASDYIQSATPIDWVVDRNTFLGPSLLGSHEDHQDLWQIFGGGEGIAFTNNVARNTETQESLLFQEGAFTNVVIENNLFDHDSRGYTCQIYQSTGLVFRDNTIVGSHWGCLFRDLASSPPGRGYEVDHNVFADTEASVDISEEGRADDWGSYDYNVSSDNSAEGLHSLRNWSPSWSDTTNYAPLGLPFAAGYRP